MPVSYVVYNIQNQLTYIAAFPTLSCRACETSRPAPLDTLDTAQPVLAFGKPLYRYRFAARGMSRKLNMTI